LVVPALRKEGEGGCTLGVGNANEIKNLGTRPLFRKRGSGHGGKLLFTVSFATTRRKSSCHRLNAGVDHSKTHLLR